MMYLPSQRFVQYCARRHWEPQLGYKDSLHPKNPEDGRPFGPLPQILFDEHRFVELSFYPVGGEERFAHAFWDCLGETTFRPSGELLISMYCSRISPVSQRDAALLADLDAERMVSGFPHQLFERWDVTVHEPNCNYEGNEEPEYAARFMVDRGRLFTNGLYSRQEAKRIDGWGRPCTGTILASPSMNNAGSFFADRIDINHTDSTKYDHRTIQIGRRSIGCLDDLLLAFSVITRNFQEGVYDHVHDDMYDFGDAIDSAIIVSEVLTGKKSRQRIRSPTFDVSKNTH